jgi:hypothetical protein
VKLVRDGRGVWYCSAAEWENRSVGNEVKESYPSMSKCILRIEDH